MKRFFLVLFILFMLLIGAVLAIPFLFGDQIKAEVKSVINEQVNARVSFLDINLSLFRDFPNLSVGIHDISVVGKGDFAADTLLQTRELALSMDIMSVFRNEIQVNGVILRQGDIRVDVHPDGKANYDIYIATQGETTSKESSPLLINIDHWELTDTDVLYLDYSLGMAAKIEKLNHTGSGTIKDDIYDLLTNTDIEALSVHYDGTDYFTRVPLKADMAINIDQNTSTYTFKENKFLLKELPIHFEGFVKMPTDDIEMDLRFKADESDFKKLLSLVPSAYLTDYQGLKTEGDFKFSGTVNGVYSEASARIPNFDIKLEAFDTKVQYPDLPTAIDKINIDMQIKNETGNLDNTEIYLRNFKMLLGKHPVDGRMHITGLEKYKINGKINAQVDLADIPNFYPLPDVSDIRGNFKLALDLNGVYDESRARIPQFTAAMTLKDGFLKTTDYPSLPLENLNLDAEATNTSGKEADTEVSFDALSFQLDQKPFEISGHVTNLENPVYDFTAKGSVDLENMLKLFPQEGMSIKGQLAADIKTKGSLAAIDVERYDQLPTSGAMRLTNFSYKDAINLPQGMRISTLQASFSPQEMRLETFKGFLGKSDVDITGGLRNYLAYGLNAVGLKKDKVVLKGIMTLNSNRFDANEWLTEEEETATVSDSTTTTATQLPQDVDFRFDAKINELLYDDLVLENFAGMVVVRDGVLRMEGLQFQTLGGLFQTEGTYDPRNPVQPKFDFGLDIINVDIPKSFQAFTPVQGFLPLAKALVGNFSSKVQLKGDLTKDLTPRLETLSGLGNLRVKDAALGAEKPQFVDGLASFTGLGEKLQGSKMKDIFLKTKFENGTMNIEPTAFKLAGYPTKLSGSTRFDGLLDVNLDIQLPKQEVAGKLSSWFGVGGEAIKGETVDLHLKVTGTHNSPKFGLDKEATKAQLSTMLKEQAKEKAQSFIENLVGGSNQTQPTDSSRVADSTNVQKPQEEVKDKVEDIKNTLKKWGFGKGG